MRIRSRKAALSYFVIDSSTTNQWHILGAGAIGCLWAGYLMKSGINTTLIVRTPTPHQNLILTRNNTTLFSTDIQPLSPRQISSHISQLILCCKAQDTLNAMQSVEHLLDNKCKVLLCQNGMGSQQKVITKYPHLDIYCLTTTEGAYLTTPFNVTHAGIGRSYIGKLFQTSNDQSEDLSRELATSELTVSAEPEISQRLWLKLAINASINGLTALQQCKNGGLLAAPDLCLKLNALSDETEALLIALDIPIEGPLRQIVQSVVKNTAENYSSTYQDFMNGRPTELAYINGFLLEQAALLDLPMPHHQQLFRELQKANLI